MEAAAALAIGVPFASPTTAFYSVPEAAEPHRIYPCAPMILVVQRLLVLTFTTTRLRSLSKGSEAKLTSEIDFLKW
jgi:hypothetical protein